MKSVLGHCLAGATVLGVFVALSAACVHNNSSLFVQDVLFPTPVTQGQACTYTSDPTQTVLPHGILDVVFRQEYSPFYLVGNDVTAEANSAQLQTETATINIQGAIVRITDTDNNQLTTYKSLAAATVYPATGSTPGYAPVSITALDQTTVQNYIKGKAGLLSGGGTTTLISYATFYGHTLGGTYVESNEFQYPIEICQGCLILFSAADDNPAFNSPNCLGNTASGGTSGASLPVPCVFGQDTTVDCSQCQDYAACRGKYPNGSPIMITDDAGTGVDSGGD